MTKGFVTIATGKKQYFDIAKNLLLSYRLFAKEPLPFALITDKANDVTALFDDVILLSNAHCSYLDKLELMRNIPYDKTIFIDADCLAYGDLNDLFSVFDGADAVSCFGRVYDSNSADGWFECAKLPDDYKSKVSYALGLHGGVYYFKKSNKLDAVYQSANEVLERYGDFGFKLFDKPADEPIVALAMAINDCKPLPYERFALSCFWRDKLKLNIKRGKAFDSSKQKIKLVHFATRNTLSAAYKKESETLELLTKKRTGLLVLAVYIRYAFRSLFEFATRCKVWLLLKIKH